MPQGAADVRPRGRADDASAPQPRAARRAHRRDEGQVDGRLRPGAARLEPGLADRGLPVRQEREVEGRRGAGAARPRRERPGRHGRLAQDGRGLVLDPQGRLRRGPRRQRARGLAPGAARPRSADLPVPRARRVHLPDEVGLGGRRRGRADAARPARGAARRHHRPRRRTPGSSRPPTSSCPRRRSSTRWTPARRVSGGSSGSPPRPPCRRRRHLVRLRQDDRRDRPHGGAVRARPARLPAQDRPGLHRPRLPRARHRPTGPQPRPGARRRGAHRAAARARCAGLRRRRRRGRHGAVRRSRLVDDRLHRARRRADRRTGRARGRRVLDVAVGGGGGARLRDVRPDACASPASS